MNIRYILFLSLMATPIFAQCPGQWVDDLYLVPNTYTPKGTNDYHQRYSLIDEKNNIQKTFPSIREQEDFPIPIENRTRAPHSYYYDDALYTLAWGKKEQDENENKFLRHTFARFKENEWELLGEYKDEYKTGELSNQLRAFPCDNNKFIIISYARDLSGNTSKYELSPFVKMSVNPNSKKAVVDNSIYHGIDELKNYMSDERFFSLASNAESVITGKYATIVNPVTGLYWCFSLEKASLVRAGSIFKKIKLEEIIKTIEKGGFTMAVLCVNPDKDGTVLVSASEEAALKNEIGDKWDEVKELMEQNSDLSQAEAEKLYLEHHKNIAKRNPYIAWYRIYPENGKVEKLATPPIGGAYEKKGNFANLLSFGTANDWRPMPDGSVSMGAITFGKAPKKTE